MKKVVFILIVIIAFLGSNYANAQHYGYGNQSKNNTYYQRSQNASIIFRNNSNYSMLLKIVGLYGGLYQSVSLSPHSSKTVYFSSTATYKLKIKATLHGQSSYHNGGHFSVTCSATEWTEGEMSFQLSSHGSGLGPSISKKRI